MSSTFMKKNCATFSIFTILYYNKQGFRRKCQRNGEKSTESEKMQGRVGQKTIKIGSVIKNIKKNATKFY